MAAPKWGRATDHNQKEIVQALERAGWTVYEIEEPVDLLLKRGKIMGVIEVKNPNHHGKDDSLTEQQGEFFADPPANSGIAYSAEQALLITMSWA